MVGQHSLSVRTLQVCLCLSQSFPSRLLSNKNQVFIVFLLQGGTPKMFRMEVWKRDLEYKCIQSPGLHITISKGLIYVYYIILYYIILYHIISYYIILYYVILCYIMLYNIMLYYIMLYYIILYYIILYYIILHYIILYYIIRGSLVEKLPSYGDTHCIVNMLPG